MFKEEYLLELLSGKLTSRGYANILGTITSMVRKYQWKKSIIVSDHNDNDLWGIERSGFFNGREKWAKGFENQRV